MNAIGRTVARPLTTLSPMPDLFLGGLVDAATHQRTDERVELPTSDLTTHGVIVGMTGSGKTGLGVVLIEEVLRAGLPALLIDPKGDLTNLCLTFPGLAPADFRPWIDEAQAKAAGVTPDEFAAQQATAWRDGLAGWGYGAEQIGALRTATDFTIYTPGLRGRRADQHRRLAAGAGDRRRRGRRRRDRRATCPGCSALVGIEADPLSSREHILLANLIQFSWSQGTSLDLPDARRADPATADPQARRVRARPVLPGRRPHQAGDEAQRPARLAGVRRLGRRPAARHPVAAVHAPTGAAAAPSSRPPTCPTRSASSSRRSSCPSSSRGCGARAAPPTCGRCSTWTRSPATCRRRPTRRRSSRSCC